MITKVKADTLKIGDKVRKFYSDHKSAIYTVSIAAYGDYYGRTQFKLRLERNIGRAFPDTLQYLLDGNELQRLA